MCAASLADCAWFLASLLHAVRNSGCDKPPSHGTVDIEPSPPGRAAPGGGGPRRASPAAPTGGGLGVLSIALSERPMRAAPAKAAEGKTRVAMA
eukprot:CAMPEP_0173387478 /NCGR_PEP_ID=MMETSP1356-20130122/9977_1 /TAXON_ID=77927 ORGANISM="Hemiselmis virescens, Strain PCC157" /NCGR_SAMPLE_ID=MMETSP1356 /ASSEMBLY_ACC=CAM_ASM_000847 /LENGTH=93 /DNA_ID=CAMNT_0014344109 /DNA_START=610 /DNA_END=888 /DNA_ORIENTATION=-